ncbi:MAG: fructose-1,6-bisphosphatase, partial [Lachnospiraceae bacterium]|nr:fructose-1,6-bisphosphatase [Lachnospiraceae bacterium]
MKNLDYLKLLSKQYINQEKVAIEIANLSAILTLPKGTEYFFSDLHGEYESFIHLLRSASGIIRSKIKFVFGKEKSEKEILDLANVIYYPEEKLANLDFSKEETFDYQKDLIRELVELLKSLSKKYTKSKVRKNIDESYVYILEELMYKEDDAHEIEKEKYYNEIIKSIIEHDLSKSFISELCKVVRRIAVDELHIVGDICDRGPRQDYIFDELINYNNVDIEWGNHDIAWMGAYVGNSANLLSCLRIAVRYNCFDMLEDGYGINLRLLNEFIEKYYKDDPCDCFKPFVLDENVYDVVNPAISKKMQKALAIMQFKVEGQIIKNHPEYDMNDRIMLERI